MKYLYIFLFILLVSSNSFAKNRYDVRDRRTGKIGFSYIDDQPHVHHSEWGSLEFKKFQDQLSDYEKTVAIDCEEIEVGQKPASIPSPGPSASPTPNPSPSMIPIMRTQCTIPQSYEVIITDLTPDEQAETQRKTNVANFKQRLKSLAGQSDLTAAELKEAVIKLLKMYVLLKDLD